MQWDEDPRPAVTKYREFLESLRNRDLSLAPTPQRPRSKKMDTQGSTQFSSVYAFSHFDSYVSSEENLLSVGKRGDGDKVKKVPNKTTFIADQTLSDRRERMEYDQRMDEKDSLEGSPSPPSPTLPPSILKEMDTQGTTKFYSVYKLSNYDSYLGSDENLLSAAKRGDGCKVKELLKKGSDPNMKDEIGCTPIHNAVKKRHWEVAELLIHRGADPDIRDNAGWTPLHYAAKYGPTESVQMLLMHVADPNAKDKSDWTPLHIAAREKNHLLVKSLLDAGADMKAKNKFGKPPWYYAEDKEVREVFLDYPYP